MIYRTIVLFSERWSLQMLAESFNYSVDEVRLILSQRTTRRLRVRPRPTISSLDDKDEDEREKLIQDHILKRDLSSIKRSELEADDGEPVDYQVLAEESNLVSRRRPSDAYVERDVR